MVSILDKYKCTERVSVPNMNRMIKHLGKQPDLKSDEKKYNEFQLLKKIKKRAGSDGSYEVNFSLKDYDTANTRALGRLYPAGASLQYLCKEYRKALVHQEYTDIDIKNAHPSLINQVFKKENIECKMLNEYVENRDKYLEVANKTEWTALLNNRVPNESASDLEKEYWNDIISCATKLFDRPYYNTYLEKGEKKNPTNKIGWAISQLATDKERETVSVAMEKLDSFGYELGTLIHDGFLVCDLNVKDGDLREAEKYAEEKTGFSIELVKKSLTDFNHEEVFGEEEGEVDDEGGTGGDRESAEVFLKWMTDEGHRFVRSGKDIWWYRPEYGVYSQDMGELKMEGESDSKGLRSRIAECPLLDNEYRSMTKKQNDLKVQFLEMIPHDGKLYDRMFNSTLRKIAFQNGVYDFVKKELLNFSSDYFFTFKAPVNLVLKGNETLRDEVYQKLFVDVFGDPIEERNGMLNFAVMERAHDKAQYYLKVLARAIAGEIYDKKFFVVAGEGNSGKGLNCDGLKGGFGDFVDNVNAECFGKNVGDDKAKARSWMVAIKNARIVFSNEVSMDALLDASVIKTFSSGGDVITGRQNHKDESSFRLQATGFFFVNDMPKIRGQDEATTNRLRFVETTYSYLMGENYEKRKNNKLVRKAEPYLKDTYIKQEAVLEAFVSLIVHNYETEEPVAPACIMEDSKEWTDFDDVKTRFLGLFEATGNDEEIMTFKSIAAIASVKGIKASTCRLGRWLKGDGYEVKDRKINKKKMRCYLGIKEYREDDEEY